jgi:hypothetical protein
MMYFVKPSSVMQCFTYDHIWFLCFMCRHGKDRERKRLQHGKHALQTENVAQS